MVFRRCDDLDDQKSAKNVSCDETEKIGGCIIKDGRRFYSRVVQ